MMHFMSVNTLCLHPLPPVPFVLCSHGHPLSEESFCHSHSIQLTLITCKNNKSTNHRPINNPSFLAGPGWLTSRQGCEELSHQAAFRKGSSQIIGVNNIPHDYPLERGLGHLVEQVEKKKQNITTLSQQCPWSHSGDRPPPLSHLSHRKTSKDWSQPNRTTQCSINTIF